MRQVRKKEKHDLKLLSNKKDEIEINNDGEEGTSSNQDIKSQNDYVEMYKQAHQEFEGKKKRIHKSDKVDETATLNLLKKFKRKFSSVRTSDSDSSSANQLESTNQENW